MELTFAEYVHREAQKNRRMLVMNLYKKKGDERSDLELSIIHQWVEHYGEDI